MTIVQLKENSFQSIIQHAIKLLNAGELVAIPTETVYGLAGDACDDSAVKSIYQTKGRPSHNPLICHVDGTQMASRYVEIRTEAQRLMDHFWPGPLTFVLPRKQDAQLAQTVHSGLDSLAVRCPNTEITRAIITALDRPIAAPSANPSGKLSPTSAQDVADGLGDKVKLIIDNGRTDEGIESTIIKVSAKEVEILRPGSITADEIRQIASLPVKDFTAEAPVKTIIAPGQLTSHYAPDAQLLIGHEHFRQGDCYIGFGSNAQDADFNLSETGDMREAAHNLFDMIRRGDKKLRADQSNGRIILDRIPNEAVGIAINDRLKRAAAPR